MAVGTGRGWLTVGASGCGCGAGRCGAAQEASSVARMRRGAIAFTLLLWKEPTL